MMILWHGGIKLGYINLKQEDKKRRTYCQGPTSLTMAFVLSNVRKRPEQIIKVLSINQGF